MEFYNPSVPKKRRFNKKTSKKIVKILAILIIIIGVGAGSLYGLHKAQNRPIKNVRIVGLVPSQQKSVNESYESIEGRYLFHGTIVMARAVEKYARGDYAQPFSQMSTFEPQKYDAAAADFECPITNNVVPYEKQIANLVFNCSPKWLPELTKYVQLYNLANNHTGDQGFPAGFNETRQHLKDAGMQYFGSYDPGVTDDICEVIALPIRAQKVDKTEEKSSIPVAFCSWHYFNFNRMPTDAELAVVKKYSAIMPVFGFVEMGNEYQASASGVQRLIAKSIVDEGAEFVFANNPHWVQDSEVYNGKLIVYSLGNFIFDQIDAETQRGVSMDVTAKLVYDENSASWLRLGKDCATFKDTCLQQAQSLGLKKVSLKLTYIPVANQNGAQKITKKASPEVQKAVEERLKWADVSKQLGQ